MAKSKKETDEFDIDAFSDNMINQMNDMLGNKVVHHLGKDENPAKINKWYSTNCKLLDWIISGKKEGGFPSGRYSEISGIESIGKSHASYQVAKWTQDNGGICLYADTEEASTIENLKRLGIDTEKRFQYAKPDSIEETFRTAESFLKLVDGIPENKKPPLLIVYDSVGGKGSEYETSLNYGDPQRPGANAKILGFGLRKVRTAISKNNVCFLIVNQVYDIIGAGTYEKKTETKGGKSLKYDCSVRVELKPVTQVYPDEMTGQEARAKGVNAIGIKVRATTVKNKVAAPYRNVEFEIHFGVGLKEHNQWWDLLTQQEDKETILPDGNIFRIIVDSAWKEFGVFHKETGDQLMTSGKFRKKEIEQKLMVEHRKIVEQAIDVIMAKVMDPANRNAATFDVDRLNINIQNEEDDLLEEIG